MDTAPIRQTSRAGQGHPAQLILLEAGKHAQTVRANAVLITAVLNMLCVRRQPCLRKTHQMKGEREFAVQGASSASTPRVQASWPPLGGFHDPRLGSTAHMRNEQPNVSNALRALCEQAGQQATGHGPDAGLGSASPRVLPRRRLLQARVLAGGLAAVALVVAAAQFLDGTATATAPPQATTLASAIAPPQATSPSARPASSAQRTVAAEPVRWSDNTLLIDFDGAPLPQAVGMLARATRTAVAGGPMQRASEMATVTLHGRYTDAATAWRHLLQNHAGFSMSCGLSHCQLWIKGDSTVPVAAPVPPAPTEIESQPDGSC